MSEGLLCAHCGAVVEGPEIHEGDDCPVCGLGYVHVRRRFEHELAPLEDNEDPSVNASWAEMPAEYYRR